MLCVTSAKVLRCGIQIGSSRCVANSSSAALFSTYDAPPLLNISSAGPGNCYITTVTEPVTQTITSR
jgi:hypothetical protein